MLESVFVLGLHEGLMHTLTNCVYTVGWEQMESSVVVKWLARAPLVETACAFHQ